MSQGNVNEGERYTGANTARVTELTEEDAPRREVSVNLRSRYVKLGS